MKSLLPALALVLFASGCSTVSHNRSGATIQSQNDSGSVVIARPAPSLFSGESARAIGFMPVGESMKAVVDTQKKTVTLMVNNEIKDSISAEGVESIPVGSYKVKLKQKDPVWYATQRYYAIRGMDTPAEGARERYLKGALGEYVLYLNSDISLHTAPVWLPEVGGVRAKDAEAFSKIYYSLPVGSSVEVK